jgi:hypothetical protein
MPDFQRLIRPTVKHGLVYTSVEELNARLGDGELMKIFFSRRSDR